MPEVTRDDEEFGRSDDPAEDAAEHLAAALGTPAWARARDGMLRLLPQDEPGMDERVEAWAAEAALREGEELTGFLTESLPTWRERIQAVLADDPERAAEARRFADSVRSLLPPPDGTTTQVAVATGHGTVNAVTNGNIYYQVVLGLAPRPRRTTGLGTAVGIAGAGAGASVAGGVLAADHLASEAVKEAATGPAPGGPLADPAQAVGTAAQTAGSASHAGVFAKAAAAVAKTVGLGGAGAAGVSVPVVVSVVTVAVVVTTTVTVVVRTEQNKASCDAAVGDRTAATVLEEAAERVERTSFRYDVTRGRQHVAGAADPHARTAWFRQGLTGGPVTAGAIDRGKVVLPAGTTTPSGLDPRWVRADGAFLDAVDPAGPARGLRAVAQARRRGCAFEGTLTGGAAPAGPGDSGGTNTSAGTAGSAAFRGRGPVAGRVVTVAGTSGPTAKTPGPTDPTSSPATTGSPVKFRARIDERGRLVRLSTEASGDRPSVTARYWDFGLRVTPSAPPSDGAPSPEEKATLTGAWTGTWGTGFGTGGFTADLTQDGNRLSGDLEVHGVPCALDGTVTGTLDGDRITFGSVATSEAISFTGRVDGDTMRGTFKTDCYDASGPWTARRSGS
ncbi:proline dehydrogenase family protein [Streptomyces nigra]|uniref:hypothetical protein n=1 Tax=Streptomyces nigra TaxID=1827580 RepID=UPI00363E4486